MSTALAYHLQKYKEYGMKANRLILEFDTKVLGNLQHAFPFVGTAAMQGPLDILAEKNGVTPFRLYNPTCSDPDFTLMMMEAMATGSPAAGMEDYQAPDCWFDPLDGLSTCSKLVEVLASDAVQDLGLDSIRNFLAQELKSIAGLLFDAHSAGGQFRVHMDEVASAPPELKAWLQQSYGEIAEDIGKLLGQ
jgi:hypothetical protein